MSQRSTVARLPSVVALRDRRYAEALEKFPQDLESLSENGDRLQAKLLWGNALLRSGKARQARDHYFALFREVRTHHNRPEWREIGFKALINAGLATKELGETGTAIQFYRMVLDTGSLREPAEELQIRNLLGSLHTRRREYEEARVQLERALELALECGATAQEAGIRLNLFVHAHAVGRLAEAREHLDRSLELAGDDPERRLRVEINLGTLLAELAQNDQAWVHFDRAQDLARRHDLMRHLPLVLAKQACLRQSENLFGEARRLASEALELSRELEVKDDWLQEVCHDIMQLPESAPTDDFGLLEALITQHGIVTVSDSMRMVLSDVQALAPSDLPVLVLGETGTGKELVALALHEAGPRRVAPFMPVNCPAIPEPLFESALFGHVKGAFTGADQDRKGLVELAGEGSIFLDEIGDLPLSIQPKLLRFLESGEYQRMGSGAVHFSNARIIAATNRDLAELVSQRLFREDLLMRLSAFRLLLPPLRERREDVYYIANCLLEKLNRQRGQSKSFSAEAVQALNEHPFPGNVRELRNAVMRGYQIARREISARDLGLAAAARGEENPGTTGGGGWLDHLLQPVRAGARMDLDTLLQDLERQVIERALEARRGDRERTAEHLGLSARALKYKLAKYGIRSRKGRPPGDEAHVEPEGTA